MAKGKLKTPDWILEGYDSEKEYLKVRGIKKKENQEKIFRIKKCPVCKSENVSVVLGNEEGKKADVWNCRKCGWKGKNIAEQELNEDELLRLGGEDGK